jgi:hypothetical protein
MGKAVLELFDLVLFFEIILLDLGVLITCEEVSQLLRSIIKIRRMSTYEAPCGLLPAAQHLPRTGLPRLAQAEE